MIRKSGYGNADSEWSPLPRADWSYASSRDGVGQINRSVLDSKLCGALIYLDLGPGGDGGEIMPRIVPRDGFRTLSFFATCNKSPVPSYDW